MPYSTSVPIIRCMLQSLGAPMMRAPVGPRWSPDRLVVDPGKYPACSVIVGASGWVEDVVDRAGGVRTRVDSFEPRRHCSRGGSSWVVAAADRGRPRRC